MQSYRMAVCTEACVNHLSIIFHKLYVMPHSEYTDHYTSKWKHCITWPLDVSGVFFSSKCTLGHQQEVSHPGLTGIAIVQAADLLILPEMMDSNHLLNKEGDVDGAYFYTGMCESSM